MPPLYRPSAEYVVGELIDAVGPDGQTVKVVLPQFAAVSSSGGAGQEVQGVDATGEAPTGNPVLVGGRDSDNNLVLPINLDAAGNVQITTQAVGPLSTVDSPSPLPSPTSGGALTGGVRVDYNTSGDKTLVAASVGATTRVHRMKLNVAGTVVVQIKNGAGTVLEAFNFIAGGGIVLDYSNLPWYVTSANTALILNLSTNVQVDGLVEYITST